LPVLQVDSQPDLRNLINNANNTTTTHNNTTTHNTTTHNTTTTPPLVIFEYKIMAEVLGAVGSAVTVVEAAGKVWSTGWKYYQVRIPASNLSHKQ